MTAADDAREHLTATVWEVLRNYTPAPLVHHADMIHTAAEAYGHAVAEEVNAEEIAAARLASATAEYWRTG
ncbi:MAG TPA: hypothetical protein VH372_17055 [Actinospica sp.]|nr:hypothetical protein [Actinospica sp.]